MDVIRSVSRIPADRSGPVEKGERLKVNFMGMNTEMVVQVRSQTYQSSSMH
jgi:hypothetical protein